MGINLHELMIEKWLGSAAQKWLGSAAQIGRECGAVMVRGRGARGWDVCVRVGDSN